jgi:hypothetical protein
MILEGFWPLQNDSGGVLVLGIQTDKLEITFQKTQS